MKCLFAGFTTVDVINGKHYPGGAAAAMALNATTLGIEAHLLSVLSQDTLGLWYKDILDKNSVLYPHTIMTAPSIPSCIIPEEIHEGSQRIWNDNGSLPFFKEILPPQEYIDSFDIIFVVNCPPSLVSTLASMMTKRNAIFIPGPQIVKHDDFLRPEFFHSSSIVFSSEEEWPVIKEQNPFNSNVPMIVITKGKDGGTILFKNSPRITFGAPSVSQVVDTTGAGDNFALHFSLSYMQDQNTNKAVEAGKKAAGEIIGHTGNINQNVIL